MPEFAELRERMVRRQIEARGITDPAILDAFREVPREAFVGRESIRNFHDQRLAVPALDVRVAEL